MKSWTLQLPPTDPPPRNDKPQAQKHRVTHYTPLTNTRSYQYKVTIVPEEHVGRALDSASKDEWSLVAMTSYEAGARGVQTVLFFRHRKTQAP
jgi:hypothetical protein